MSDWKVKREKEQHEPTLSVLVSCSCEPSRCRFFSGSFGSVDFSEGSAWAGFWTDSATASDSWEEFTSSCSRLRFFLGTWVE